MNESSGAAHDLDAVRKRLRGRGYLGGSVERYLLSEALEMSRLGRRRLRVAVKGVVLVAPLAALWTAGLTLASDPRSFKLSEGLLLWIYDLLFAVPSLALLFLLASLCVPVLRRTGWQRVAEVVALFVAFSTAGGLAMLLWPIAPPAGGRGLWIILGGLLAGLTGWVAGIACWLGGVEEDRPLPARARRGVLWFAIAVLWTGMFFWAQARAPTGEIDTGWSVRERAPRLMVIGIDGLDRELFELLAGVPDSPWAQLPVSGRPGSWTREPGTPAEIWTSVWTGRAAAEHGVGSAEERHLPGISTAIPGGNGTADPWRRAWRVWLPGRRAPISSAGRRVRTIWEVVSLKKPVAAIGWWSTWPAFLDGEGGGFVVSDRALAKLQNGGIADREIWPDGWHARLQTEFAAESERIREDFDREFASRLPASWIEAVREAHFIDAFALERWERFSGTSEIALSMVYLPGLDIVRHRLRENLDIGNPRVLLEVKPVLEQYIDWLGSRLQPWFQPQPDQAVLLLGDPGRGRIEGDEGLWMAWGEGIRQQEIPTKYSAGQWFSWVARLLGFPRTGGMPPVNAPGFADWVTDPGFVNDFPAPKRHVGGTSSDFDEEMLDRLRSLGYVQ